MAASYKPGQKYFQHRNTGAVFQYNERLVGNTDLVEMQANNEGELVKVEGRVSEDTRRKLNPTQTPEKKAAAPGAAPAAKAPAKPTLTPAKE